MDLVAVRARVGNILILVILCFVSSSEIEWEIVLSLLLLVCGCCVGADHQIQSLACFVSSGIDSIVKIYGKLKVAEGSWMPEEV